MTTWAGFEQLAPAFAAYARRRIEATGLGFLATLRADGAPRISGIEPFFAGGHLWLGMMPNSRKGADLRRDGRFALHNASVDKEVTEGDIRIEGVAVATTDPADLATVHEALGQEFVESVGGQMEVFRVDLVRVTSVRPGGDELIIEHWRPGAGVKETRRR